MRVRILLIFLYILVIGIYIFGEKSLGIKHIISIGSNEENHTFFKISDAVMDKDHNIYVGDIGGFFISKFNRNGEFVVRVGKFGQGPGDFADIDSINIYNDKIFIWDIRNIRLNIFNKDLKIIKVEKHRFQFWDMKILENEKILCSYSSGVGEKLGKVLLLDKTGKVLNNFFPYNQFGKYKPPKSEIQFAMTMPFSRIKKYYSWKNKELLICFQYPLNPASLYVYDLNGREKKRFLLYYDKKYKFQYKNMNLKKLYVLKNFKTNRYSAEISSVFIYKNNYIIFLNKTTSSEIDENLLYIFNNSGILLFKKKLNMNVKFFNITSDGYLIGTDRDSDIPQVLIYKLEL